MRVTQLLFLVGANPPAPQHLCCVIETCVIWSVRKGRHGAAERRSGGAAVKARRRGGARRYVFAPLSTKARNLHPITRKAPSPGVER